MSAPECQMRNPVLMRRIMKTMMIERWLNIYKGVTTPGYVHVYESEEQADLWAEPNRLCAVRLSGEYKIKDLTNPKENDING